MEEEDLDAQVFLVRSDLLARVELAALVDVFAAAQAFHGKGSHESDGLDSRPCGFGSPTAADVVGIEIRGVVFLQDFSLRHCEMRSWLSPCEGEVRSSS